MQLTHTSSKVHLAEHFEKLHKKQAQQSLDELLLNSNPFRVRIAAFVYSGTFKAFMASCVFLSIGIVVHETDSKASDQEVVAWAYPALIILMCCYTIELALRMYISGHKFFWTKLNVMDLVLVAVEILTMLFDRFVPDLPNAMVIRFFRLIRLARLSAVLMRFRPLYLILQGFFSAMQAIFFATILVFFVLSLWSIVSVEFLHPIAEDLAANGAFENCERCGRAYSSVMQSNLTLLQTIIVGDSWAWFVMPLIEHDWRCVFIFGGVFITVQVGMLNLILAVIVDSAAQARHDDEQRLIHEKKLSFRTAQNRFNKICKRLDVDQSGTLSEEELFEGLSSEPELNNLLTSMDITEREVGVLFSMMDVEKCGEVSYAEFTDMLHRFKNDDLRTHLMFLKHYVLEMTSKLDSDLGKSLKQIEARNHRRSAGRANHDKGPAPASRLSSFSNAMRSTPSYSQVSEASTWERHASEYSRVRSEASNADRGIRVMSRISESSTAEKSPAARSMISEEFSNHRAIGSAPYKTPVTWQPPSIAEGCEEEARCPPSGNPVIFAGRLPQGGAWALGSKRENMGDECIDEMPSWTPCTAKWCCKHEGVPGFTLVASTCGGSAFPDSVESEVGRMRPSALS